MFERWRQWLTLQGIPEFGTRTQFEAAYELARRRYPVRYFLLQTLPYKCRRGWYVCVHRPWYWLKCRVWHRYNVVYIRSLPPTWNDRDQVMLHAAFQLLTDFVDRERPDYKTCSFDSLVLEYGDDSESIDTALQIRELYDWWQWRRHNYHSLAADDDKLRLLMNVRRKLWS